MKEGGKEVYRDYRRGGKCMQLSQKELAVLNAACNFNHMQFHPHSSINTTHSS